MLKFKALSRFLVSLTLALILIGGGVFYFATPCEAAAEMHVKIEASSDDGSTWKNYGGTEGGDGYLFDENPGDTMQFRIKVWNTGDNGAIDVEGLLYINDTGFIESWTIEDTDLDNNSTHYLGIGSGGVAAGMLDSVASGTTEGTAEAMLATITLADSFPIGTSTAIVEVRMTYYDDVVQEAGIADATDLRSNFRIVVAVAESSEDELISTGIELNSWIYAFLAIPALLLAFMVKTS